MNYSLAGVYVKESRNMLELGINTGACSRTKWNTNIRFSPEMKASLLDLHLRI
jgi:hypothetical protein